MNSVEYRESRKTLTADDIIVCPDCDMIVAVQPLNIPYGSQLICPRCRYRVRVPKKNSIERTLALSITALLLFLPAHFMLLLRLESLGIFDQGTVFDSMTVMYSQKYFVVALMVLLTAILIPLAKVVLLFIVSFNLAQQNSTKYSAKLFRWYCHLEEWGMTEVYLIGIFVTIIKMSSIADIGYGIGFLCFTGLSFSMVGSIFTLDRHYYWQMIEALQQPSNFPETTSLRKPFPISSSQTALNSGLIQCHTCHKVMHIVHHDPATELNCHRCGATVHARIPRSLSVTLALVLTAIIFSFPANALPIMQVDFLGSPEKSTIMDGIEYFFQTGSYGIGIIILTASILVPVFKVVGLFILLYSIHFNRWSRLVHKSIMFRFIKFIGRWSMLDIFVIAMLCALVDFGFFTTITAAPAATFFTFVVMTTMFAAISFDPRLLWDITTAKNEMSME